MDSTLFEKAQASIAFNPTAVNNINTSIALIDPRLFSFAYYSPVPLQKDISAHACFYLATINMYSLIWDCGPMLNNLFGDVKNNKARNLPTSLNMILSNWQLRSSKHLDTIAGIRSDVCHNNSDKYYFCKISREAHHDLLLTASNKNFTTSTYTEDDWKLICDHCLNLYEDFFAAYNDTLMDIQACSRQEREKFASLWLDYTTRWYERNEDITLSILAEIYPISQSMKGKIPQSVSKNTLRSWAAKGWSEHLYPTGSNKLTYKDYIKGVNIRSYIEYQTFSGTAWPKDVLSPLLKKTALSF